MGGARVAVHVGLISLMLISFAVGACTVRGGPVAASTKSPSPSASARSQQTSAQIELLSPLGFALYARDEALFPRLVTQLDEARRHAEAHPDDLDAAIWHGRRLGYLWRMSDAIDVFSRAVATHPDEPHLLRHRGHRLISVRRYDAAIADLALAAAHLGDRDGEIEPDGMPNEANIPLTTLGFNVWYHLALSHYLRGDFETSLAAWRECARRAGKYDDNSVAVTYWTYLTLRRLGQRDAAECELNRVQADMRVIENHAYHRLVLLFKGLVAAEELTNAESRERADFAATGYGVGAWYLLSGSAAHARELFDAVIATGDWPAFGYIAAEAELVRLGRD